MHLTFKTVFLLALGSGKHKSEIHAWLHKTSDTRQTGPRNLSTTHQLSSEEPAGQRGSRMDPGVMPALTPALDK